MWRSDGTGQGTSIVSHLFSSTTSGGFANVDGSEMALVRGSLLFQVFGGEPFRSRFFYSDGTSDGTAWIEPESVDELRGANAVVFSNRLVYRAEPSVLARANSIVFDLPLPPPRLFATSQAITPRPKITWTPPGIDLSYEVWLNNKSTNTARIINQSVPGPSFTPSVDLGIGNYTLWARSIWSSDTEPSAWSQPQNFQIRTPVTGLRTQQDAASGRTGISWAPLIGAARYDVWIDRVDVPQSQVYRNSNVTNTSVVPSLSNGRYRVWVRGIAADGMVAEWSVATAIDAVQTPAVTSAAATFDRSPTIAWTSVAGASSYEVWVNDNLTNRKVLQTSGITGTSYTLPELPASSYRVWVRSGAAAVWSAPYDVDTRGRASLIGPATNPGTNIPTFSWGLVEGATRYELWVDRVGGQQKIVYQPQLTDLSFSPSTPMAKGTYRAWVRAFSSNQAGLWSVYREFTIASIESNKPIELPSTSLDAWFCGIDTEDCLDVLDDPLQLRDRFDEEEPSRPRHHNDRFLSVSRHAVSRSDEEDDLADALMSMDASSAFLADALEHIAESLQLESAEIPF